MSKAPPQELTIFLQEDDEGCVRTAIAQSNIMYRIPRDFVDSLVFENELKQAGIYLLVNEEKRTVYVGQADFRENGNGILSRMLESHGGEVDDWNVGFALTSGTPHFFGATELNYLERFFYDEAKRKGFYTVINRSRPHANDVDFSTKMVLEKFTEYVFFGLRKCLNCKVYAGWGVENAPEKAVTRKVSSSEKKDETQDAPITQRETVSVTELFFIHSDGKDAHAEAVRTDANKLIVKKGSRISQSSNLANQKGQEGSEKLRNQLISDGTIKDRVFTVDYTFNSPSTAATVILGASSSGNAKWKNKDGMTLGEILGKKGDHEISGQ